MSPQPNQIRTLYKAILRLHKSLPKELKELGDVYVKDEFRRHIKSSDSKEHLPTFIGEWTEYYSTLIKQVGPKNVRSIGKPLSEKLDELGEHQLYQLYELHQSISTDLTNKTNTETNETKS